MTKLLQSLILHLEIIPIQTISKIKTKRSININQKDDNENIFHKSTYNLNIRNNESDFLQKLRKFDQYLSKEIEERKKKINKKRKKEKEERKKKEEEEKRKKKKKKELKRKK